MTYRGTAEGNKQEEIFVQEINRGKHRKFISLFNTKKNVYGIRVTKHVLSKETQKKVKPKSDAFLAVGNISGDYLKKNNSIILENDLKKLDLTILPKTGISIKLKDSKKYQIHKFTQKSFIKILKQPELGVGASFYCKKIEELNKNNKIVEIWGSDKDNIIKYFENHLNLSLKNLFNFNSESLSLFEKIKTFSNKEIKRIIKSDRFISNYVFNGIGNFEDPYCAYYIYEGNEIKKSVPYDFIVTTGSNRIKKREIVLKP